MNDKLSDIQRQVERGISILKEGGLVAYPTDTVYGLGAGIDRLEATNRIYEIKERPLNMPLPLLLGDLSQVNELAAIVPTVAHQLIERFWPGALTLVLLKSASVPEAVAAGGDTVAVRLPAHPVPVALSKGLGCPIIGTSANLSGRSNPLTADEVYSQLGGRVDYIIDGGRCPGGKESTVIDVTGDNIRVLREGAVSMEELKEVCGELLMKEGD